MANVGYRKSLHNKGKLFKLPPAVYRSSFPAKMNLLCKKHTLEKLSVETEDSSLSQPGLITEKNCFVAGGDHAGLILTKKKCQTMLASKNNFSTILKRKIIRRRNTCRSSGGCWRRRRCWSSIILCSTTCITSGAIPCSAA